MSTAPQSQHKTLLLLLAVILLAIAGIKYFYPWDTSAHFPSTKTIYGVCLETKDDVNKMTMPADEQPPYLNPKTKKRTVYPWYFCNDCRNKFAYVRSVATTEPATEPSEAPGGVERQSLPPQIAKCPLCKGLNTGSWTPEDPDQAKPAGAAPLPPLPA